MFVRLWFVILSVLGIALALFLGIKCGYSLCNSADITISYFNCIRFVVSGSAKKVVYYGVLNETDIVIKSTSYESTCGRNCSSAWIEEFEISEGGAQELLLCPTTQRYNLLLTQTSLNFSYLGFSLVPEALLLHLLPAEDGWPVPKFIGTCGNSIITEYVGPMLSDVPTNLWETRALLAVQLLDLAEVFTFKHPNFAFYFTDLSPYNIAVRENGSIALIDLDNVIILDRLHVSDDELLSNWKELYVSESFDDTDAFTFSSTELCQHHLSDFNYYAICKYILKQSVEMNEGLLKTIPDSVNSSYPLVEVLRDECAKPSQFSDRIAAGRELKKWLLISANAW